MSNSLEMDLVAVSLATTLWFSESKSSTQHKEFSLVSMYKIEFENKDLALISWTY